MSLPAANHRWTVDVKMMILFYGMFLQSHFSESSTNCGQKNILFISAGENGSPAATFPNDIIHQGGNGVKLCFNIQPNETKADCCRNDTFNCDIKISSEENNKLSLTMEKEILSKQDIVVIWNRNLHLNRSCMESQQNGTTDFLLNSHACLYKGGNTKNVRLSQDILDKNITSYDEAFCKDADLAGTSSKATFVCNENQGKCYSCEPPNEDKPGTSTIVLDYNGPVTLTKAVNIMKNLSSLLDRMGSENTAGLKIGNITGVLAKLSPQNQTGMNFGFAESGNINILEENADLAMGISLSVQIPKEASMMAVTGNSTFAGVLLFPGIHLNDSESFFLNDEVVGIEMGAKISNLSQTIDIHFTDVTKGGNIASCRSWDGTVKGNWITDGCETKETNSSITCRCSHLTFFSILMSPPPGNISSADFNSLTSITSAGCGVSIFFLAVALVMHFLIRKTKASKATKILINLFIAMLFLNLAFLVNETIAGLENSVACVMIAVVLHYSMLATFTWFFMQAVHLYFNLLKPAEIKYYMKKIVITGWATPAVVVIVLLALQKYGYIVIYTDDGNSAKMCWIPDAAVHRGVNIGFYAVVFVFTLTIFIASVRQIIQFKPAVVKVTDKKPTKTDFFSILGLFVLLGITWAFAFFAEGALLRASYYVFTVLNSFQGFFLFIYYYWSSKLTGQDKKFLQNSSTATVNTAATSSG